MHTALKCLAEREILKNVRPVFGSGGRGVLTEGIGYEGIWLECGPHESLGPISELRARAGKLPSEDPSAQRQATLT